MTPYVTFQQVGKTYDTEGVKVNALHDVNFEIGEGEVCVIVGQSGAGKTTLLNILGGMDTLTTGTVFLGGEEVSAYNRRQLTRYRREDVGFVFQFYNLIPNLTVKENIEVGQYLSQKPLEMDALLHTLGLWEHRDKFPHQLSGGQQQRCAIGRALIKNPALLLCDELTGALDYQTAKEILALLETINQTYHNTIIIVTHNEPIKQMAHRVLKLHDGRIVTDEVNDHPIAASELQW